MRHVFIGVVILSVTIFFFSCEREVPTSTENIQSIPVVQQGAKNSETDVMPSGGGMNYSLTDYYLVEYSGSETQMKSAVSLVDGSVDDVFSEVNIAKVSGIDDAKAKILSKVKGIKTVTRDMNVQWIKPSEEIFADHIGENESFWAYQWGPVAISAPQAWDAGYTGQGVRVAVIDGGISSNHLDLVDNIDFNYSTSFVAGMNFDEDTDEFRHASHVAGIIAAEDNGRGTIGVAPNATIISIKALDGGSGSFSAIIQGIIYAATVADADIINMSIGGYLAKNDDATHLKNVLIRVLSFANQLGVTVIASAGNEGIDMDHVGPWLHIPGDIKEAINVSATAPYYLENFDNPASYTNYGQRVVDFAAPGGDFAAGIANDAIIAPGSVSEDGTLSYYWWASGTSMATPHVAGVAALIVEKYNHSLNPAQVEAVLRQSADDLGKPGNDDFYGQGRVNAYKAVMQ